MEEGMLLMGVGMSNIRILAETMGSRKERYEMVLDAGGAEEQEDETILALGTRLANKEIRVSMCDPITAQYQAKCRGLGCVSSHPRPEEARTWYHAT